MKINYLCIFLFILVLPCSLMAQKKGNRTIRDRDFVEEVNYLEKSTVYLTNPYKMYYWIDAGVIHKTQGEYKGKLLHGTYIKCDQSGNLIEKGYYRKGLKVGDWKKWFTDGKLKQISHWKLGLLHGKIEDYDHGKIDHVMHFKNGNKHGTELKRVDGKLMVIEQYKNGILIETPKSIEKKEDSNEVKNSNKSNSEDSEKTKKTTENLKLQSKKTKQK